MKCFYFGAAPEVQNHSTVSASSDMFSLGLVIAAIFNKGRPLIQANHSNPNYTKQMEMVNAPLPLAWLDTQLTQLSVATRARN